MTHPGPLASRPGLPALPATPQGERVRGRILLSAVTQAFWLKPPCGIAGQAATMARPPPPASSQEVVPPPSEDDGLFNAIKVASSNVGASQEESFTSITKLEGFRSKLKE